MGTKGMRGKGWLRKVGEKRYQLTSAALSEGETLLSSQSTNAEGKETGYLRAELDRHTTAALARILSTSAARKALENQGDSVTFNEACGFWDITVRSNANTLNARLAEVTVLIDRALAAAANSDASGLKIGANMLKPHHIKLLSQLNQQMQERFKAELGILRRRTDERLERKLRPF
jgi:hypothetical protein